MELLFSSRKAPTVGSEGRKHQAMWEMSQPTQGGLVVWQRGPSKTRQNRPTPASVLFTFGQAARFAHSHALPSQAQRGPQTLQPEGSLQSETQGALGQVLRAKKQTQ